MKEDLGGRLGCEVTIHARAVKHFGGMGGGVRAQVIWKEVES